MNPNRLTLEELKQLNPSMENPIELVCDDGEFTEEFKTIKIIGINSNNGEICFLDTNERPKVTGASSILHHYPSFKKEPRNFGQLFFDSQVAELYVGGSRDHRLHKNLTPVTITERGEVVEAVE